MIKISKKSTYTIVTNLINVTFTQRDCGLDGICTLLNNQYCTAKSNVVCSCNTCSHDKCNDDTLVTLQVKSSSTILNFSFIKIVYEAKLEKKMSRSFFSLKIIKLQVYCLEKV